MIFFNCNSKKSNLIGNLENLISKLDNNKITNSTFHILDSFIKSHIIFSQIKNDSIENYDLNTGMKKNNLSIYDIPRSKFDRSPNMDSYKLKTGNYLDLDLRHYTKSLGGAALLVGVYGVLGNKFGYDVISIPIGTNLVNFIYLYQKEKYCNSNRDENN